MNWERDELRASGDEGDRWLIISLSLERNSEGISVLISLLLVTGHNIHYGRASSRRPELEPLYWCYCSTGRIRSSSGVKFHRLLIITVPLRRRHVTLFLLCWNFMNGKFLRGSVNHIYANARRETDANFTTTGNDLLSPSLWPSKTIREGSFKNGKEEQISSSRTKVYSPKVILPGLFNNDYVVTKHKRSWVSQVMESYYGVVFSGG
jgi:hypothetical protein